MNITFNVNGKNLEFATVAEVFNKDGKNTSREFRNKLFGSWLTDEFDSAIKLAESIKARRTLLEGWIHNLNTLEEALSPAIAEENFKLYANGMVNMDATQLKSLASAVNSRLAEINS